MLNAFFTLLLRGSLAEDVLRALQVGRLSMRFISAVICALAFCVCAEASAAQPEWRVTTREGVVRVTAPGGAPHDATQGESLDAGAVVTTGAESRAILQNGAQTITMAANSRMRIAEDSTDAMTRILQDMGAILFQVDKRGAPHFRVETPLLAAVVKGTTFTVTAGGDGVVHVAEGLVEVRAANGGAAVDVPGGKTVRIDQAAPTLIVPVAAILNQESAPSPVLNYAAASGGLVESVQRTPASLSGVVGGVADAGAKSLGAAQTTLASLSVVGLGGDLTAALNTATGGDVASVNVDLGGGAAINVGLGDGGGLANVGANAGGGGASLAASLGDGGLANVRASFGNGLVTADASAGAGNLGANVGVAGLVDVGATAGGGGAGGLRLGGLLGGRGR
jgi:hypothetical protein